MAANDSYNSGAPALKVHLEPVARPEQIANAASLLEQHNGSAPASIGRSNDFGSNGLQDSQQVPAHELFPLQNESPDAQWPNDQGGTSRSHNFSIQDVQPQPEDQKPDHQSSTSNLIHSVNDIEPLHVDDQWPNGQGTARDSTLPPNELHVDDQWPNGQGRLHVDDQWPNGQGRLHMNDQWPNGQGSISNTHQLASSYEHLDPDQHNNLPAHDGNGDPALFPSMTYGEKEPANEEVTKMAYVVRSRL